MRPFWIAALCLAPSLALAQSETPADLFGPANPRNPGPTTVYRSVFDAPAPTTDDMPWRQANDEAGRLRGHAGQLRDTNETPAASPNPATTPPSGMQHHGTH
jgi:hypothetical protein